MQTKMLWVVYLILVLIISPVLTISVSSEDSSLPEWNREWSYRQEIVLPLEELSKIIEKYDTIGVATCYCRHRKDLIDEPCKKTDDRKNCFSFGRTAEFLISQGFQERISKEEALEILKKCEDDGLVHKAFHTNLDPMREIDGLCNCCKCCCGTFEAHYAGAFPLMDISTCLCF